MLKIVLRWLLILLYRVVEALARQCSFGRRIPHRRSGSGNRYARDGVVHGAVGPERQIQVLRIGISRHNTIRAQEPAQFRRIEPRPKVIDAQSRHLALAR